MSGRSAQLGRSVATGLIAAAAGWAGGALPWLVRGGRLPLSSIWPSLSPGSTPWVPLPFGEYSMGLLIATLVVGGWLGVVLPPLVRLVPRRSWASTVGAALGEVVALAVTFVVVHPAVRPETAMQALVGIFLMIGVVAAAIGVGAGVATVRGRHWGPGMAGGILAGVAAYWISALVIHDSINVSDTQLELAEAGRWLVLPILAVALVRLGMRPLVRLLGWVLAMALAWAVPAVLAAADYPGAMLRRGMDNSEGIREIVRATLAVLRSALGVASHPWLPYLLAVVLAPAGALILGRERPLGRSRHAADGG